MSNKSSHKIETAKRYAKALLLSCNNRSDVQIAKKDFDDFIKTFNKLEELKFFFQTPLINPIKKKKNTNRDFKQNKIMRNFFKFFNYS